MRYGRRATAFSTTAVSWVCVLCGAVTGAWMLDLIPYRKPMTVGRNETATVVEPPVTFDQELQESQSEPSPTAMTEPAKVSVDLEDLLIPATLGEPEAGESEGVIEISFDQPAASTKASPTLTNLTADQTSQAHLMGADPAFGSAFVASSAPAQKSVEPAAPQDPFAAYEAKQQKFEFVAAQGQPATAQPAYHNEAGWQQFEQTDSMTMKSAPDAAFVQTSSRGGDGFTSPAAAGSVTVFQPSNPHSGQFQQTAGKFSEVDAYTPKPGQTANVETRHLTFQPERDQVQLLNDPYRGEATVIPTQVDSAAGGVQQTGFSQPASPIASLSNSSSILSSESRFSTTSPGLPKEVPTQTQLIEKVLGVPGAAGEDASQDSTTRKTPQEEVQRLRTLSELYWSTPQSRPDVQKEIDELSRKIYFSPSVHYMAPYTVQQGDMLQNVAKTYNVPWQYLARLNRITPEKVRAGSGLKVIKGPFSAIVDLSDYELIIHAHGYYVCRFPVGTGKNDSTPTGTFTVLNKEVNPTYYGSDGVIAADDPANPLGERWIDLGNSIGIHGTIDPDSIGKSMSKGCLRLNNEHVSIVYDLLGVGSEVTIVP